MTETTPARPFTAAAFNQYLSEKKLMGSRCTQCVQVYLPPRAICPACQTDQLEWIELKGEGRLAAYTSVFIGPTLMIQQGYSKENPYVTGIVELEEGGKISARILGVDAKNPASIQVGTPLSVDFVEAGDEGARKTYLAFKVK